MVFIATVFDFALSLTSPIRLLELTLYVTERILVNSLAIFSPIMDIESISLCCMLQPSPTKH